MSLNGFSFVLNSRNENNNLDSKFNRCQDLNFQIYKASVIFFYFCLNFFLPLITGTILEFSFTYITHSLVCLVCFKNYNKKSFSRPLDLIVSIYFQMYLKTILRRLVRYVYTLSMRILCFFHFSEVLLVREKMVKSILIF